VREHAVDRNSIDSARLQFSSERTASEEEVPEHAVDRNARKGSLRRTAHLASGQREQRCEPERGAP
jgi:hypothetical protein